MVAYFSRIPAFVSSYVSTIGLLCLNELVLSLENRGWYALLLFSIKSPAGLVKEIGILWLIRISNNT